MTEGRIAEIVSQTCRRNYIAEMVEMLDSLPRRDVFLAQGHGDIVGHGFAHTRHFHTMGQAVVDKDTAGQGENLSLVLQAPERRREDKAVVVTPEISACGILLGIVIILKSEALVVHKAFPLHATGIYHLALLPI